MVAQRIDHIDADDGEIQRQVQILEEPWAGVVFEEFEQAGGVRLNASLRLTLQTDVELYQILKMHSNRMLASSYRKSVATLIKHLDAAIPLLQASPMIRERVLFMAHLRELLPTEDQIEAFKLLRERYVELQNVLARPGPKGNFYLDQLLRKLEIIFLDAGGTSTRISRRGEARFRESPFINFAWAVLLQVPESMRPASGQALAVRWERIKHQPTRQRDR
jgi:hypothetical protein